MSLAARPLLLSIRALLSFYVIATVNEPYDILLLFAFVALFKALIDRNKSIRFLGKRIEYTEELWRYIYEIIFALVIASLTAYFLSISWNKVIIISALTINELLFSFIALKNEKKPEKIFRLAAMSLLFTALELLLSNNLYNALIIISFTNIFLAAIVLRKELFNSNPKPVFITPDFYLILQSLFAFGSKYVYLYFDGLQNDQIVQIFLVSDVYLFLFNVFYPVLRTFELNNSGIHLLISSLVSTYLFVVFGPLYSLIFFLSYGRLFYTAILVNDKRNTSMFLYVSVFDLISRLCLISFFTNIYIIVPSIAGSMVLTIIIYARAKEIGYHNTLS
jgi:hypothetical protein